MEIYTTSGGLEFVRTPDECFAGLPGFPFTPHYVRIEGLRLHYLDEGPRDAPPILLMHGEPSWSYLYRKMIPVLTAAGHRIVAPDLIGFGRSDKPIRREDYTYQRQVDWMTGFLRALDLTEVTLVCQDWGGLIGLRLLAEHSERFARVVAANTGLPTGDQKPNEAFFAWQRFSQEVADFPAGAIVASGCVTPMTPEVLAAYDAPFPDEWHKAGARQFPLLVPSSPDDPSAPANRAAWEALRRFTRPFLTAFSDSDPITAGGHKVFQKLVPGAQDQPHATIEGAGHFLQEDRGEQLAKVVAAFVARTSS